MKGYIITKRIKKKQPSTPKVEQNYFYNYQFIFLLEESLTPL